VLRFWSLCCPVPIKTLLVEGVLEAGHEYVEEVYDPEDGASDAEEVMSK